MYIIYLKMKLTRLFPTIHCVRNTKLKQTNAMPQSCYFTDASFHHCCILINSPTTHIVKCSSPNTLVFPFQYRSTIAKY